MASEMERIPRQYVGAASDYHAWVVSYWARNKASSNDRMRIVTEQAVMKQSMFGFQGIYRCVHSDAIASSSIAKLVEEHTIEG